MLRINKNLLDGKTISSKVKRPETDEMFEILTKETIPPEAIEVKVNGKWQPLNQNLEVVPKTTPVKQEVVQSTTTTKKQPVLPKP
tara:strand:+ start:152 stop:406 length:255 start_codon:yes stop_codon:yes gene_type:complete